MVSEQPQPSDLDRFHFAIHDGKADDCPECRHSTVQGAHHAPLKQLDDLAILAELLAAFEPGSEDYEGFLPELVAAAVAYGKAIGEWRQVWEYGDHDCKGKDCL